MLEDIATREMDPQWNAVETAFEIGRNRHYESVFALGTGYLSLRSSIEEGFENDNQALEYLLFPGNTTLLDIPAAKSKWGTYIHVLAARHPFRRMGLVNLPYGLGLVPCVDGEKLDLETSTITGYRRWLDLRAATLYRTLTWRTLSGCVLDVRFARFMDPALRFVCVQRCELEMRSGEGQVTVTSFVDTDVRTNGCDKLAERALGRTGEGILYADVTTNIGNRVVVASGMATNPAQAQDVAENRRRISAQTAFALRAGQQAGITKVTAVAADAYFEKGRLVEAAADLVASTLAQPVEELHRRHAEQWQRRWDACDVRIEADDAAGYNSQRAIRQAIYHLLRAKGEGESRNLVDPKGMVGELYYGAAFWDMEIFINPFFIYTNPAIGRNTPEYRYSHLDRARALARHYGYSGARYPWMQAPDGDPVVSMWHYADHQIHITADVIIGMWHYVRATGDTDFLFRCGAEMIVETARYWRERADVVPGREGYQIYGVMGPDEYKPLTNNNAYTNYTARFNLQLAGTVVDMMKARAPAALDALRRKTGLTDDELAAFAQVARGLSVPTDGKRKIVWQCDDFDTAFVPVDVDRIWKDKNALFGKHLSQEKLFRYKTLKQSDVAALMAVFPTAFDRAHREASFDYYKPHNIHDSSNSMCHHMMVAAGIGRADEAYEAWLRSMDIDFGKQPRSSDGLHCANVGGMWQEVVFGFAGLLNALCAEELTFAPCLPRQIRRIAFPLQWHGARVRVTVTPSEVEVENLSDRELAFTVCGARKQVAAGGRAACRYGQE